MFHYCDLFQKDNLVEELLNKKFDCKISFLVNRHLYGFWECTYKKVRLPGEKLHCSLLTENLSFVDRFSNLIKVDKKGCIRIENKPTCYKITKKEVCIEEKFPEEPILVQKYALKSSKQTQAVKTVYYLQCQNTKRCCKNADLNNYVMTYSKEDVIIWKNTRTNEDMVWRNLEMLMLGYYKYKNINKEQKIVEIKSNRKVCKDNVDSGLMIFHGKIYSVPKNSRKSSGDSNVKSKSGLSTEAVAISPKKAISPKNTVIPSTNFDFYKDDYFFTNDGKETGLKLKWMLRYVNFSRSVYYFHNVRDNLVYAWRQYQPLFKLFYVSRIVGIGTREGIILCQNICKHAHTKNLNNNITGQLTYHPDFFQVQQHIEGTIDAIKNLWFDHILKDTRHDHIRLMSIQPIAERTYAKWGMRYHEIWESKSVIE